MFSAEYYNFPYPLFVTACHMVVQFAIASFIRATLPERYRPVEKPTRRDYAYVLTASDCRLGSVASETHHMRETGRKTSWG
jgi:hypothetical protein